MLKSVLKNIIQNEATRLFIAITAVNLGNYLLNLLLGRFLGPADFAEAGILATAVLILSFIAIGIQMTAAKFTAGLVAEGKEDELDGLQEWMKKRTFQVSLGFVVMLIFTAPYLQSFLHFRSILPLILVIAGIPAYFMMSVQRGVLQGQQQFRRFAGSFVVEMVGRLIVTVMALGLVWSFELANYSEAVGLGFLASFIAGWFWSRTKGNKGAAFSYVFDKKQILTFFVVMMSYEGTQIAISYSDVILVKHYFTNHQAGLYAALSLVGRMVYFGTWALVMVLVPKVVQLAKKGLPYHKPFYQAFTILFAIGSIIVGVTAVFPQLLVQSLFGKAFLEIGPYLWKYAAATTLFAGANLFAYFYLALGKYTPVVLSAIAGLLQITLITLFHNDITTIIHIQMALMAGLLCCMVTYHLVNHLQNENRSSFALSAE